MSSYEERFKTHEVHNKIDLTIEKLDSVAINSPNQEISEKLNKIIQIIIYLKNRLVNTNPLLIREDV